MSLSQTEHPIAQQAESASGSTKPAWWRGTRGEWYLVAQEILGILVFLGPRTYPGWPAWPSFMIQFASVSAKPILIAGTVLFVAGIISLGKNLTPLPLPKQNAILVETGIYRFVRHPIYGGLILIMFGVALNVHGWLTLLYVLLLCIGYELKSRKEEEWLQERFPGYATYKRRVARFIPFIY